VIPQHALGPDPGAVEADDGDGQHLGLPEGRLDPGSSNGSSRSWVNDTARDRDVPLAGQILIYPMLDDRNTTPGPIPPGLLTWTYDNNFTGWHAPLGDEIRTEKVSPIAAPGRLTDFTPQSPSEPWPTGPAPSLPSNTTPSGFSAHHEPHFNHAHQFRLRRGFPREMS
jgi:hypothetical protein